MLSNPTLKHFVEKMAAISFCSLPFVRTAWLAVQQKAPQIPHMDELVSYFDSTWINEQFKALPISVWNFVTERTTSTSKGHAPTAMLKSGIEGWKKVVSKPCPNIYEIIDIFKREEASTQRWKCRCWKLDHSRSQEEDRWDKRRDESRTCLLESILEQCLILNDHLETIVIRLYMCTQITQ